MWLPIESYLTMIYAALSSSAFIGDDVKKVLDTAVELGTQGIEWTDDGFVRPGDLPCARETMIETLRAGLCTVSYATLFRVGSHDRAAFGDVLATARELNSPLVRAWSAPRGACPDADAAAFVDEARRLGDETGKFGITICVGVSPDSVLASYSAAASMLSAADHPFVKIAWEPGHSPRFDAVMDSFSSLTGRIGLCVVKGEDLDGGSEDRSEEWLQYLDAYDEQGGSPDMARQVVLRSRPDGDSGRLASAVASIREWSVTLRRYHRRRVF